MPLIETKLALNSAPAPTPAPLLNAEGYAVKQCSRCLGPAKLLTLFPRDRARKDGRAGVCNQCRSADARAGVARGPAAWLPFNHYGALGALAGDQISATTAITTSAPRNHFHPE